MRAPFRLTLFAAGLGVAGVTAAATGNAIGPDTPRPQASHAAAGAHGDAAPSSGHGDAHGSADPLPGGLQSAQDGYRLVLDHSAAPAGRQRPLAVRVLGPDGAALRSYTTAHDKDLHLIAVRRDLTGFQHVHPTLDGHGTWTTELDLTPGSWRVFADFDPAGDAAPLTLGTDLHVPGSYVPQALPAPRAIAAVDGYTVSLRGDLVPGKESELTLSVSRDGRPVSDLEPYLAAYGHVVALREGDLAYLHVHPDGTPGDGTTRSGPDVVFHTTLPTAGSYRLFLDFKHDGVVRTAAFTVHAGEAVKPHGH
jgi:hypothetical protein